MVRRPVLPVYRPITQLLTMKPKYDLDRAKLLNDAPALIKKAISAGWMSYPVGQKYLPDGSLDPMLLETERIIEQKYTPQLCRMAYDLREQGMTLDEVTEACGVSRGSICYLISKGHEQFLTDQRTKD